MCAIPLQCLFQVTFPCCGIKGCASEKLPYYFPSTSCIKDIARFMTCKICNNDIKLCDMYRLNGKHNLLINK